MLILSRRVAERIKIADNIYIEIVSVKGKCVTIGIEAPRDISIQLDRTIHKKTISKASQEREAVSAQDRAND